MQFLCIFNDNRRILKQKSVRRRPFTRTNRQLPLSHFLSGEGVGAITAEDEDLVVMAYNLFMLRK